ncbi:MAG TPA: TetR/AcrR family transcriptional regulator [Polyangiaceae bacterium]|jgi:AcrR family transcriptional regulator
MPSPPKTTDAEIVAAARKLVERRGRHGFSMKDVADAVGVRAPSLYGRFADRASLLAAVEIELWRGLGRALARAPVTGDPTQTLAAQARAYRAFAKGHPQGYALIFDAEAERTEEGARARAAALAPTVPSFVALVGEKAALGAARVLTPFLHGFVSMELAGAFRLGGGLDDAFERGVTTILAGLQSAPKARKRPPRRRG